jgi:hypothetical protein
MDFASVKSAAESLGNFLGQLAALERIIVTNETYESYSEPVKPLINTMSFCPVNKYKQSANINRP